MILKYETDSRKVVPGQTFVAIKGHTVDGHDFINAAIKNGATKIIATKKVSCDVPIEVVENSEEYLKNALINEYSSELKKLKIIGVTGTNGKTTTCYLTYQLLKKLNVKVAYMGTIGFFFEEDEITLPNTTPDVLTIYKLFLNALAKGCEVIVMEVSSHALDLERIAGLHFNIGAFTNLTEDHLDYHKTIEKYLEAKLKILNYMDKNGTFIVNKDDEVSSSFISRFNNTKTISLIKGDYQVANYQFYPNKTTLAFVYNNKEYFVETNLTGKFNIYNYLTTLAIVNQLGYSIKTIISLTKEIYPPIGRCETFKAGDSYAVVDYAHTPDAVLKVILAFKELAKSKIITVLGCGGDRDPLKRPIMGEIATDESDYVIFTNDNPRTEDPKKIMNDIIAGVSKNNYEVIYDRHEAIKKSLSLAKKDDIVLVLGKGHENYQIFGHEKVYFDDREEIKKFLKK